jgi:hypothetical protein
MKWFSGNMMPHPKTQMPSIQGDQGLVSTSAELPLF